MRIFALALGFAFSPGLYPLTLAPRFGLGCLSGRWYVIAKHSVFCQERSCRQIRLAGSMGGASPYGPIPFYAWRKRGFMRSRRFPSGVAGAGVLSRCRAARRACGQPVRPVPKAQNPLCGRTSEINALDIQALHQTGLIESDIATSDPARQILMSIKMLVLCSNCVNDVDVFRFGRNQPIGVMTTGGGHGPGAYVSRQGRLLQYLVFKRLSGRPPPC